MLLLGCEPLSATQDFTLSENHTARPTKLGDLINFTTGSLSFVGGAVGGAVVDDGVGLRGRPGKLPPLRQNGCA